jgi:ATP-dependent exoDNAse (exonuclease V) beta subunit
MPTTIINASAGSGKTYRLAVAYLQALLQPLPDGTLPAPQSVLATTFTRAAASEILERVLRRLALAVILPEELSRLVEDIDRPGLERGDLVRLLESVCHALPLLQIGTIDGLFSRIVRVMGLDLAFPPSWSMASDALGNELALLAADRLLNSPEVRLVRAQWQRYAQFKPGIRVRAALVELLEESRFVLLDADVAEDNPELAEPQIFAQEEVSALLALLDGFEVPLTKGKPPKPHSSWVKEMEKLKSLFNGESTCISLLKGHPLLSSIHMEGFTYYKVPIPEALREILGPLNTRAREDLRRLHEARLPALAALGRRYHEFRRVVAHERGAYRFAEIEAAARILPSHLSPEDLYFRLDGQIQHLLLDEFQDTSLNQFRFLWPIIADVRANGRLFFAVGDVKQSIYGWRGADRRLLNRLGKWLDPTESDPHLIREHLTGNRRSCPAVLRAINLIFQNLDQAECLNPGSYADSKKRSRAEARQSAARNFIGDFGAPAAVGGNHGLAGRVRLLIHAPAPEEEESPDEIATILNAVEQHRREDANREIAILCRRRKLMPAILAGLRTRGIAASGEGGNPVTDSAAVEAVLSMLTWLDHPGHTLAREHAKLSGAAVAFGFSEEDSDATVHHQTCVDIMRRGLAAVISDWVKHGQFRLLSSIHDQVRLEQLVELARQWDAANGGRLSLFVKGVRSQRVDNPASSRVRVMTIHGSKGLEFDAVILADLEMRKGGSDGPRLSVTMTAPEARPAVSLILSEEEAELLGLADEYQRYQEGIFEEDLSVLYVALTRAKSYLDVVLPMDDKPKPSLGAIIRERWGQQNPGSHLVDECAAIAPAEPAAPVANVPRDPGIWEPASGLAIPHFRPVPSRLDAITPSGQEGGGIVKLGSLLNPGTAPALERGTAVHALLSRIKWIGQLPSEREWAASIPSDEANPQICQREAQALHPRLANDQDPLTQAFNRSLWIERWKKDGVTSLDLWIERRFAAIIGRDLMNGSFDRVILGRDENEKLVRAEILDFKTDLLKDETEREARRLHYQPQLEAYRLALGKLTGLHADSISARLVWIN